MKYWQVLKSSKTLVKSYYQELILNKIIIYSLYGIMYSNLDQREGLLVTYHLDTIFTTEFNYVYVKSSFFTNYYHFWNFKQKPSRVVTPQFRGEKYCETSHSNHNGIEETVIGLPAVSRLHIYSGVNKLAFAAALPLGKNNDFYQIQGSLMNRKLNSDLFTFLKHWNRT